MYSGGACWSSAGNFGFPDGTTQRWGVPRFHYEPVQSLGGGVNLVIVFAIRKYGHLVKILCQPLGLRWNIHETALNHAGDGMHPHFFITRGLIPSRGVPPSASSS